MQEIERKFLITNDSFKENVSKKFRIVQGYLSIDPQRTVRVRIKGDKGYLTIKGKSNTKGTTRIEIEEEITIEKAEILLKICLPNSIDKTRYEVVIANHIWEIDEFYGKNQGLFLAEIELNNEDDAFQKPLWIGKEVTGNKKYYNSYLSKHPYTTWE